jgi:MFS family permease
MLSLSLGWSLGSLVLGQIVQRLGNKKAALAGAVFLVAGCALTLSFSTSASTAAFFSTFLLVGLGMGFVTLATLLVVQSSLDASDLGVATSSHQFARTLGGTVGIGVCGGVVAARLSGAAEGLQSSGMPADLLSRIRENMEVVFNADTKALIPADLQEVLQQAVAGGVSRVFWVILAVSLLCFCLCALLPGDEPGGAGQGR